MNWKQRIAQARKKGGFTQQDIMLSGDWYSCSLGERLGLSLKIKKQSKTTYELTGYLLDRVVSLGCVFNAFVAEHNFKDAGITHRNIQALKDHEIWRELNPIAF